MVEFGTNSDLLMTGHGGFCRVRRRQTTCWESLRSRMDLGCHHRGFLRRRCYRRLTEIRGRTHAVKNNDSCAEIRTRIDRFISCIRIPRRTKSCVYKRTT